MSELILDTSVAIAWYLPEIFSASAREYQRQVIAGDTQMIVPSLHYWEVANVLRTYVRRGELERAQAEDIYLLHLDAPLVVADPPRERILKRAFEYDATSYDAVYIELALGRKSPLLTAEKTTTPWVVKLGRLVRPVRA